VFSRPRPWLYTVGSLVLLGVLLAGIVGPNKLRYGVCAPVGRGGAAFRQGPGRCPGRPAVH
jgi:hypothetical protein